jgi:hypothetical protein
MNMPQQNDSAKQQIIDDLLKEAPSNEAIEVELPSEGRVYQLEDPTAPITIRPMTFDDEKSLVNASKNNQDPTNVILQRCVTNIKVQDLLQMDKLFLLMKLREISYGDDYNTLLICQHCKSENLTTVKLSQLNINPVPDDFCDPVEVLLPDIKKKAKVKLPRVRDEKVMADSTTIFDQLWRFVQEIEGYTDKSIIAAVVNKLPIRDVRTILNAIKTDYGIDTRIKFACKDCGGVSVVELPITANFFNVS